MRLTSHYNPDLNMIKEREIWTEHAPHFIVLVNKRSGHMLKYNFVIFDWVDLTPGQF